MPDSNEIDILGDHNDNMTNVVEQIKEVDINRDEVILRAKANRMRDQQEISERQLSEDGNLSLFTEASSNLEHAPQANIEKTHNEGFLNKIVKDYKVSEDKFYFKDKPETLAFKDKGSKLITSLNDTRVSFTMAAMAQARGWTSIKLSGHSDFRREVWLEASLRGIKVSGYTPLEKDINELNERSERLMRNSIEPSVRNHLQYSEQPIKQTDGVQKVYYQENKSEENASKKKSHDIKDTTSSQNKKNSLQKYSGILIEHGEAPYMHNPENQPNNYYIKLKTDAGEKTVWGIDLKRAVADSQVKKSDLVTLEYLGNKPVTIKKLQRDVNGNVIGEKEIETHRNSWSLEKKEQYKIAEAVAEAVISEKIKNPELAKAVNAKIKQRLAQRTDEDKPPSIRIYDKDAMPQKTKETERIRPQVERNSERTR